MLYLDVTSIVGMDPSWIVAPIESILDVRVFVPLVLAMQAMGILWILSGLDHAKKREGARTRVRNSPSITVLIPARNEAQSLPHLLESLTHQDYPKDRWEVLVIDDQSTDGTALKALQFKDRLPGLRVIRVETLDPNLSGKQNALHLGFQNARGEFVVCTDADCQVPPTWVSTYAHYFERGYKFVAGPTWAVPPNSPRKPDSLPGALLVLVHSIARAMFGHDLAIMSQGTNLGCERKAYFETGGYPAFDATTADDCQLMQAIRRLYKDDVLYTNDPRIINNSYREMDLRAQLSQVIRWVRSGSPKSIKNFLLVGVASALIYANVALPILAYLGYFSYSYALAYSGGWVLTFTLLLGIGDVVLEGDLTILDCVKWGFALFLLFFLIAVVVLGHITEPVWKERKVPV